MKYNIKTNNIAKYLLVIAYDFPPYAVSGTFRTLAWVRLLAQRGWGITVITVNHDKGPIDKGLLDKVPKNVKVIHTSCVNILKTLGKLKSKLTRSRNSFSLFANQLTNKPSTSFKDWLSWWLHVPDAYIGWIPYALPKAIKIVGKCNISVIYSTSPYMTAHLIAGLTKAFTGLPWIADFRDPWRSNPFRNIPYKILNHWDSLLEAWVVRQANHIICVTEYMKRDFINRYPFIKNKISYIPNGYDPEDYENLKPLREFDEDCFVITHTGTFYGPRSPIPIFKALSLLQQKSPELVRKIRLQLIGMPEYNGKHLKDIATQFGISHLVRVIPTVPKSKALAYLKGSNALLLIGFKGKNSKIQVSAKFYEYLAIGKPILILAPQKSDVAEIFYSTSIPGEICEPDNIPDITDKLAKIMKNQYQPSPQIEKFNRHNLVIELETILNNTYFSTKHYHH